MSLKQARHPIGAICTKGSTKALIALGAKLEAEPDRFCIFSLRLHYGNGARNSDIHRIWAQNPYPPATVRGRAHPHRGGFRLVQVAPELPAACMDLAAHQPRGTCQRIRRSPDVLEMRFKAAFQFKGLAAGAYLSKPQSPQRLDIPPPISQRRTVKIQTVSPIGFTSLRCQAHARQCSGLSS